VAGIKVLRLVLMLVLVLVRLFLGLILMLVVLVVMFCFWYSMVPLGRAPDCCPSTCSSGVFFVCYRRRCWQRTFYC